MQKVTPPPMIRKGEARKYPNLRIKDIRDSIALRCAPTICKTFGKGPNSVVILPDAAEELKSMIGYKRKRAKNICEQQFLGLGYIVGNEESYHVIITNFLYIYSLNRSEVGAQYNNGTDDGFFDRLHYEKDMINKYAVQYNVDEQGYEINPFVEYGKSEVVLFGHTHPSLTCFFSTPDRRSSIATKDFPAATFVVDPHSGDMKGMVGKSEDVTVYLYTYQDEQTYENASATEKVEYKNEQLAVADEAFKNSEDVVGNISYICNNAISESGAKGKFRLYKSITGKIRIKFKMNIGKPRKVKDKKA